MNTFLAIGDRVASALESITAFLADQAINFVAFLVIVMISAVVSFVAFYLIGSLFVIFFHAEFDHSQLAATIYWGLVSLGAIMLTCAYYIQIAIKQRH